MEPQININSRRERNNFCIMDFIIGILFIVLAFVLGVIIGTQTGIVDFLGIGALVILAFILVILIIIRTITIFCKEYCRRY